MRAALIQLCSGDDPRENLPVTQAYIQEAAAGGAQFVLTPEVTNCVSNSRRHQNSVLQHQADDITLAGLRQSAEALGIWLLIGSLALKTNDPDGRFANRSFLISPKGDIVAQYDKIHMFDVQVTPTETFRESEGYRPGDQAVLANTPFGPVGMTVCYDLRFGALYRRLSLAGAQILTVPAAFSPVTGAAHWEPLLRARAIENGCYVLAPGQTGDHAIRHGKPRQTYGHSMAVSPWGEVLCDAGLVQGVSFVDFFPKEVEKARMRVPSLTHGREFAGP